MNLLQYAVARLATRLGVFRAEALEASEHAVAHWRTMYVGANMDNWLLRRKLADLTGRSELESKQGCKEWLDAQEEKS